MTRPYVHLSYLTCSSKGEICHEQACNCCVQRWGVPPI